MLVLFIVVLVGCVSNNEDVGDNRYDDFAKCLTDNGAKFYGAYWCPHCANQKEMFGDSIELINYIECSLPDRGGQTQICKDAGIKMYPTWEFKDGKRVEGVMSFEMLSEKTNCRFGGE